MVHGLEVVEIYIIILTILGTVIFGNQFLTYPDIGDIPADFNADYDVF